MSVATFVEVSIVLESRFGAEGLRDLDLFVDRAGIDLVAVHLEQGQVARWDSTASVGGRHPAGLLDPAAARPIQSGTARLAKTDLPTAGRAEG